MRSVECKRDQHLRLPKHYTSNFFASSIYSQLRPFLAAQCSLLPVSVLGPYIVSRIIAFRPEYRHGREPSAKLKIVAVNVRLEQSHIQIQNQDRDGIVRGNGQRMVSVTIWGHYGRPTCGCFQQSESPSLRWWAERPNDRLPATPVETGTTTGWRYWDEGLVKVSDENSRSQWSGPGSGAASVGT